ncbi:MAG: adenine deaminase [Thermodesulfobacteriota bacterium]
MDLKRRIEISLGKKPVDLLLKNGRLVNVLAGEIHPASVAIHEGWVVGFGDYDALETVDLNGRFLAPGFIDGHVHLESSMLSISEFARNVVPQGTTSVVADPHEIANVLGIKGIQYILDSSDGLAMRVFIMFPSCVPATPFETSGAELLHTDMMQFRDHPRVLGLAEMMNFPGVLMADPEVLSKIGIFGDKVKDGHAPGLRGKELCAYAHAGIGSDHECTVLEEALEKLRVGMKIMIRQGSAAKNLDALLPVVNEHNSRNCFFVTDDTDPRDLREKGHVAGIVRTAIGKGLYPVRAIQMATLNPASYFKLTSLGALAPGYQADILVLEDLEKLTVDRVYHSGRLVAERGRFSGADEETVIPVPGSVLVDWERVKDFSVKAEGSRVRVIEVIPGQIVTRHTVEQVAIRDGYAVADAARDILKLAVIERHRGTGEFAVGFIRGFGLKRGALASTVAHDSHNIIVVGADDDDMLRAAREAADMGGGMAVVASGAVMARLPLPIAGLMSAATIEEVDRDLAAAVKAARELGCNLENPFATLSFMALTPIPELKITDRGLFDSTNFQFVPLFV